MVDLLGRLDDYVPDESIASALGDSNELLESLAARNLIVRAGSPEDAADRDVARHWVWGHDARFFHFSTRAARFQDLDTEATDLAKWAAEHPPPPPCKDYGDYPVRLPEPASPRAPDLWAVLRSRRTRRTFAPRSLQLSDVATILGWTWGSLYELEDPLTGAYLLKTSPSGGARHPGEVYPLLLRVDGVDPGLYHYCPRRHALAPLRLGRFPELAASLCADQPWVASAAAVFFMTAVLERSMWKYRGSHAYRVLLLDAGHLGQTFHLVCTALGLAPFTSAALDAAGIEGVLELDPASEAVLYAAATGAR